jgi:ribose 5-phosphate isomerase B
MKIAIGSDHRGVDARRRLIGFLERHGHSVKDCGSDGLVDRGILLCCTGVGMAIAANKIPGVRAATCHDEVAAEMSRRHNDLNVLCLAAEMVGAEQQEKMTEIWLNTDFEGGRHERRLSKISALEATACGSRGA